MIIDSHCHLNYKDNDINIDSIIERAKKSGVDALLNISTKRSDFNKLIKTSSKFKNVYYSLGIHPHESSETNESIMNEVIRYSDDNKFIAIGETGLDFFYNHSDKGTQIKSLEMHIELAQEINLPLIIHMRDAEKELINIFTNKIKIKTFSGIIHCFTGSSEFAQQALDLGFYISASGIITFKKSVELRETFKKTVPLSKLLVETDSPFLSPEPNRGKPNEPSYIVHTIDKLADIYNVSSDKIKSNTTSNFLKLFNKVKI